MHQNHKLRGSGDRFFKKDLSATVSFAFAVMSMAFNQANADLDSTFTASPLKMRPLAWYWLNANNTDSATLDKQLISMRDSSLFSGICPCYIADNFLANPDFLPIYRHMINKCAELGMPVSINDDYYCPSGSAYKSMGKFPQYLARQAHKTEYAVAGPTTTAITVPSDSTLLGCVAVSTVAPVTVQDITLSVSGGKLAWAAPAGNWKVMVFLNGQSSPSLVNYLSAESVKKWISLAYDPVYNAFPQHFGSTIFNVFFDDVGLYQAGSAKPWATAWADEFNDEFKAKYGFSPVKYYPALWGDIGPNTGAARNLLFGFRNEMFAVNFGKAVGDWCAAHKVESCGHYAGTGGINWCETAGDPIKFFKYVQQIGTEGWTTEAGSFHDYMRTAYRVQAAAMYLYDKKLVVNQHYALIFDFTKNDLYGLGIESFICGVNYQFPDGAWYNKDDITFPPDLSWWGLDPSGKLMPDYNKWAGRCQMFLQDSRHVADIALLFPIAAYTADNYFGHTFNTHDYMEVGEALAYGSKRDFTYMHPEVLDSNCSIDAANRTIDLNNRNNWEKYKVFIIPGLSETRTIHASTMRKAREFYQKGGVIICTAKLPLKSAEIDQDTVVTNCVSDIFGLNAATADSVYKKNTNAAGGKAYFIPKINESVSGTNRLTWVLDDAVALWDVKFVSAVNVGDGQLGYIHKVKNGMNYYFFGNNSASTVNTQVQLRGKFAPRAMDPHTGAIANAVFQNTIAGGGDVTLVTLKLDPYKSVFISSDTSAAGVKFEKGRSPQGDFGLHAQIRGPSVRITCFVPANAVNAPLLLQIFDVRGRVIRTLAAGKPSAAGRHTINFDADGFSGGNYLCRMTAGGFEKSAIVSFVR